MKVSRRRRAQMRRSAEQIRLREQIGGAPIHQIVDAIRAAEPDLLPLEAWRLAYGWSRRQVIDAVAASVADSATDSATDLVADSAADSAVRDAGGTVTSLGHVVDDPRPNEAMLCRWEHGDRSPSPEHVHRLTALYQASPAQLGLADPANHPDRSPGHGSDDGNEQGLFPAYARRHARW